MRRFWPVLFFILATFFVLLTQRWMGSEEGFKYVMATDSPAYLSIAQAAPGYPAKLPYHIAQRFLPHYGIGLAAKSLGISPAHTYEIATGGLVVLILFFVFLSLSTLKVSSDIAILLVTSLFLNPYSFRYYWLVPTMFTDLIFVLGLAVMILGMFQTRFWLVLTGILVAIIGRNTILLMLPGILLGVWAFFPTRFRFLKMGAVLVVSFVAFEMIDARALTFGKPDWSEGGILLSLVPWLKSPDFTLRLLSQHVLRSFLPILMPLAILFGMTGAPTAREKLKSKKTLALALMSAGILSAALLPSPAIQQNSQGRFSAYAIVVMTLLLGFLWNGTAEKSSSPSKLRGILWIVLGSAVAASSLHHMYTRIGPINVADFGMFHVAACELAAIASWYLFSTEKLEAKT